MTKIKTHSGAKKRFKITKKWKVKHEKAYTSHLFINKKKAQRKYKYGKVLDVADNKRIKALFV